MIQSMTGFGKATAAFAHKKINVEIKSLNSKALDLSTRIAPLYREKEMEIRQLIADVLKRGKVEFAIWIDTDATGNNNTINADMVEFYYQKINEIAYHKDISLAMDWNTLLRLPDVMSRTETEELGEEEWTVALDTINEALAQLVEFMPRRRAALRPRPAERKRTICTR